MLIPGLNIEKQLNLQKRKDISSKNLLEEVQNILQQDDFERNSIKKNLNSDGNQNSNCFEFDLLDTDKIYHINTIKNICIDYRLRFLDSHLFKNTIPEEAISKIKQLEKNHETVLGGFKIMAPSKLFKLKNYDDPLLFAPIGNDYYYLIHKWGNDMNPLRKLMMLPLKNMGNSLIALTILSILTTMVLPVSKFGPENLNVVKLLSFLFVFKSYCAILIYYCFWKGKNFSSENWNSKYYN